MDKYGLEIQALASVSFISLAPVLILLVLPLDSKLNLKKLIALAAGCLLGDAFLHLIPESSVGQGHDHNHQHHHNHNHDHSHDHHHDHHDDHHHHHHGHEHDHSVGLKVLAGIMVFFILEKWIYSMSFNKDKAKKKKNDDHKVNKSKSTSGQHNHDHDGHVHASGILNLIADFLHNFTDGLAIGASFTSGTKLGLSTTLAIFLHEIPHEIGDYAILVQSGFTKKKAILLQTITAIGAFSGTILSLAIGGQDDRANKWILPFTAGGFIYIATVHLIPQLKYSNFKQTSVELVCFAIGVGIMYGMAWLE